MQIDELYKFRESQLMTNMEIEMQSGKIQELLNDKRKKKVLRPLFDDSFTTVLAVNEEKIKPKNAYLLNDSKIGNGKKSVECYTNQL